MKFDVVVQTGYNTHIMRTIKANSKTLAQYTMWTQFLDEEQRKNCMGIEVHSVEEKQENEKSSG
jgi:hypothetical protein